MGHSSGFSCYIYGKKKQILGQEGTDWCQHTGVQCASTLVSLSASPGICHSDLLIATSGGGVCSSAWQAGFVFQARGSQVRPGDPLHGADTLSLSPHVPNHSSLQQRQLGAAGCRADALREGEGNHSELERALDTGEHQGGLGSG